MIIALIVAAALVLSTAIMAVSHRADRRAHATIKRSWAEVWEGAEELLVTVVGPPGQVVTLGRRDGDNDGEPIKLESDGFTLRAADGQSLDVPAGTRVTLYDDRARIDDGRVTLVAGTRLATRVSRPASTGDGPFRGDGRPWTIPEDSDLLLSDKKLSQVPFEWARNRVHWSYLIGAWLLGALLAAGAVAVPRLFPLPLAYVIALVADAVFLRGMIFIYATTTRITDVRDAARQRELD